jgi:hypothetical protein
MKNTTKTNEIYQFRPIKSYKPEEIIAAGGTTAFAEKMGKTGKQRMERIAKLPKVTFTDDEWNEILEILKNDK